jgi:hypothetical protein
MSELAKSITRLMHRKSNGDDGKMFGSVTAERLPMNSSTQFEIIWTRKIHLEHPIRHWVNLTWNFACTGSRGHVESACRAPRRRHSLSKH